MEKEKKAFSLVELIIIVVFLGVFAVVAVPRLNLAIISKKKAETTARKIVTDLRRTRGLAISNAANNPWGFQLRMLGSSPYTGYEIKNHDTGATVDSHTIDSVVSCTGSQTITFGPLGNETDQAPAALTLTAEGKSFTITIISATGAIQCVEN